MREPPRALSANPADKIIFSYESHCSQQAILDVDVSRGFVFSMHCASGGSKQEKKTHRGFPIQAQKRLSYTAQGIYIYIYYGNLWKGRNALWRFQKFLEPGHNSVWDVYLLLTLPFLVIR